MRARNVSWLCLFLMALVAPWSHGATPALTSNDVVKIMAQALTRAQVFVNNGTATNVVIAVIDREGFVLGALSLQPSNAVVDGLTTNLAVINAITKAGTAAFLSSDQYAFTSRTAGYIVQSHFPPLIANAAPGPLVGVNFSSLSFSDINFFKNPAGYQSSAYGGGGTNGTPIATAVELAPLTGLNGSPGGLPLYKSGQLVGGVGAAVRGKGRFPELGDIQLTTGETYNLDEDVALAGQTGYQPSGAIRATVVLIGGIRLPYVNSTTHVAKTVPLDAIRGQIVTNYELMGSPPAAYPPLTLGGVKGELRQPIIDDPVPGTLDGVARLTAQDVTNILALAAKNAAVTRAGIRMPLGTSAKVFITVVNNPGFSNGTPEVLGTFRIKDATLFSWDVAVQKARTALFFSTNDSAYSTRAVGFLAQALYPPGINGTAPGPFLGLQDLLSLLQPGVTNPLNGVYIIDDKVPAAPQTAFDRLPSVPLAAPDPRLPNGITIFPGGFPLYRNGVMVGAIGVSGDGVDVDDLIAAWGTVLFLAPESIRSDQIIYRGTRLPYAKFPRNPSL
jgi:uncharacterized protein GlcG (DUF336 family)